ncbi:MAG: hypothetical protein IJ459_05315 [Clostridia bacterium]|nr:hypothetical protein [Clostridia bacterium]
MNLNQIFFNTYIKVDKVCCAKLGVERGGISAYINKLTNNRFAPDREETLERLINLRNARNALAHEEDAMGTYKQVTRQDVKWLQNFERELIRKKDPISLYLRRARSYVRRRNVLAIIAVLALAAAAVLGYFYFI